MIRCVMLENGLQDLSNSERYSITYSALLYLYGR